MEIVNSSSDVGLDWAAIVGAPLARHSRIRIQGQRLLVKSEVSIVRLELFAQRQAIEKRVNAALGTSDVRVVLVRGPDYGYKFRSSSEVGW